MFKKFFNRNRKSNRRNTVQSVYNSARNTPNYYPHNPGKISGVNAGELRKAYRIAGTF